MAIYYLFLYDVFKVQSPDLSGSGDEGIRTPDPLLARQVLSQLSYTPMYIWVDSSAAKFTSFTKDADVPTTRFKLRLRLVFIKFSGNGLKWTRTIDLTLIRRAL